MMLRFGRISGSRDHSPSDRLNPPPPPNGLENTIVAALIDLDSGKWDRSIILALFDTQDRDYILGIPLVHIDQPVIPYWHFSQNGVFSIKSAYSVAQKTEKPIFL
ncbi:UNVERIFIED_CONTAM: hypothetical protein Sradi_0061500 [Sesamum radiatum]|uniref:Uncharacterized protein n=1 Tax=Sesamum radiatum TaxID=300843 RepID=A0AAW2WKH8_SESRA